MEGDGVREQKQSDKTHTVDWEKKNDKQLTEGEGK